MMIKEFLQYAGFCAPIISSLSCAVMLAIYRCYHGKREENILYRLMITCFLTISLLWAISLVYVYCPRLYVCVNILYFIGLMWGQVVFYQFIYTLTRLPGEKRFPRVHYIIPLFIVGVFAGWSAFVPFRGAGATGAFTGRSGSRLRGLFRIVYFPAGVSRRVEHRLHGTRVVAVACLPTLDSGLFFQYRPFVFGLGGAFAADFVQSGSPVPTFCHLFQEGADFFRFAVTTAVVAGGAARHCLL